MWATRNISVSVTIATAEGLGSTGALTLQPTLHYRIKSFIMQAGPKKEITCPQLDLFEPALRERLAANKLDRRVPKTALFAERTLRALRETALWTPNFVGFKLESGPVASLWRHMCHQYRGYMYEFRSLLAMSHLMVPRSEEFVEANPPTEEDQKRLGVCVPFTTRPPPEGGKLVEDYSDPNTPGSNTAKYVQEHQGLTCQRAHTARTKYDLHTASPLLVEFAMRREFSETEEPRLNYDIMSKEGIMSAVHKMALIQTMHLDRSIALLGVSGDQLVAGCGTLGLGLYSAASRRAAIDSAEQDLIRLTNSDSSLQSGVTLDVQCNLPDSTSLGAAWMTRQFAIGGSGSSAMRTPPYLDRTFFGQDFSFSSQDDTPHTLSHGEYLSPNTENLEFLAFGLIQSPVDYKKPLYITMSGTSHEAASAPPYSIFSIADARLGPAKSGAGNSLAVELDARLGAIDALKGVLRDHRTIGVMPYATLSTDREHRIVIDCPLHKGAHQVNCLHQVQRPLVLDITSVRSLPVPRATASRVLSGIFRA